MASNQAAVRAGKRHLLASAAAISIPLTLFALDAHAQSAAPDQTKVEEVVVTGSRVARAGFSSPSPTTVVGAELLQDTGATQIADVLNNLPAFKGDYSASATGPRSFASPGAAFANLRSLGSQRTLTMVNGRRIVPSTTSGQADLNIIPSILIDHVDIVTGGSSAAYGSDAIAGVVNVVLKQRLDGLIGDVSYNESSHHDDMETHVGLAGGMPLAGGRIHITAGGEYVENKGAGNPYTRAWGRDEYGLLPNPTPGNGQPARLIVRDYRPSNMAPGGLVVSGPLKGLEFLPGGQTRPFQYGSLAGPSFMSGGEGYGTTYALTELLAPLTRYNAQVHVDFDLNDSTSLYAEAAYADAHTVTQGAQRRDTTPFTVSIANPYLPQSVVQAMTAAHVSTLSMGRNNFDLGFSQTDVQTKVSRYTVGGKGDIGGGWSWDAYAQFGRTSYDGNVNRASINANFLKAVDAVVNPANGQIVCRSTLTDPGNGCAPANIFGSGSISDAAKRYILGDERYHLRYDQTVAAANLHGSPFSTWAGEASLAAGLEFRSERANGVSDPLSQAGAFNFGNQKAIRGKIGVSEGYVELVTPLAVDQPWAKRVELDTAIRETDYSTSGAVQTWKVGLNYAINDQIRLRGNRSRDIRAANIDELYTNSKQSNQFVVNPQVGTSLFIPTLISGNANLQPEVADSYTVGIVLKPSLIPQLNISVDYYDIDVRNAIASLTFQQIVDLCYAGNTELCQYVIRSGTTITSVLVPTINLARLHTQGVDFEARYSFHLDQLKESLPGTVSVRLFGTYVNRMVVDDGLSVVDRAGEVGSALRNAYGVPKWRTNAMVAYDAGPLRLNGAMRYVGGGDFDNTYTAADISNNKVNGRAYFDLSGQYTLNFSSGRKVELYGVVENLTDRAPPIAPSAALPTNPTIYDVVGRTFRIGLRFKL